MAEAAPLTVTGPLPAQHSVCAPLPVVAPECQAVHPKACICTAAGVRHALCARLCVLSFMWSIPRAVAHSLSCFQLAATVNWFECGRSNGGVVQASGSEVLVANTPLSVHVVWSTHWLLISSSSTRNCFHSEATRTRWRWIDPLLSSLVTLHAAAAALWCSSAVSSCAWHRLNQAQPRAAMPGTTWTASASSAPMTITAVSTAPGACCCAPAAPRARMWSATRRPRASSSPRSLWTAAAAGSAARWALTGAERCCSYCQTLMYVLGSSFSSTACCGWCWCQP